MYFPDLSPRIRLNVPIMKESMKMDLFEYLGIPTHLSNSEQYIQPYMQDNMLAVGANQTKFRMMDKGRFLTDCKQYFGTWFCKDSSFEQLDLADNCLTALFTQNVSENSRNDLFWLY